MCEWNLNQGEMKKENQQMPQLNRQQEAAEQSINLGNLNNFYAEGAPVYERAENKRAVGRLVPDKLIKDLAAGLKKEKDAAAQNVRKLQEEIDLFRQEKDNLTKQAQSHQALADTAATALERTGALHDAAAIKAMADAFDEEVKKKEKELRSRKSEYEKAEENYQAAQEIAASNENIPLIAEELSGEKETILEADKEQQEAYLEKADRLAGFIRNLEKICKNKKENTKSYTDAIEICHGHMEQLTDTIGRITLKLRDFSVLQNIVENEEAEFTLQSEKYEAEAGELNKQRGIYHALYMAASQWKKDGNFTKFTDADCEREYRERDDIRLAVDEFVKKLGEYGGFSMEAAAIYADTYEKIYFAQGDEIDKLAGRNAGITLKNKIIPAKNALALIKQMPDWIDRLEEEKKEVLETEDVIKKAVFLDKVKQMQELLDCTMLQNRDKTKQFKYVVDYVKKHKTGLEATAKKLCAQIYHKQAPEAPEELDFDLDNIQRRLKDKTDLNELTDFILKYSVYIEMGNHPRLKRIDKLIVNTLTEGLTVEEKYRMCCILQEKKYVVSKRMRERYEDVKEKLSAELPKERAGAVSGLVLALSGDADRYNDGLVRIQQALTTQEDSFPERLGTDYAENPKWSRQEEDAYLIDNIQNKFHAYKNGIYKADLGDWKEDSIDAYVKKHTRFLPDQITGKMTDYISKADAKTEDKQAVQALLGEMEGMNRLVDFCMVFKDEVENNGNKNKKGRKEKEDAFLRVPPVLKAFTDKFRHIGTMLDLKKDEIYIAAAKKLEHLYRDVLDATINLTKTKLDYDGLVSQYAEADKQEAVRLIEFDRQHGDWLAQLQQERREILNSPDMGRKYRFLDNVQRLAEFANFDFLHKGAARTAEEQLFSNVAEWYSVHREEFQETVALVSEQIFRQQSPDFFKPLRINPEAARRKLRNKNKMKELANTVVKVSMYNSNYDEEHYGNLNEQITMLKNEVDRISEGTDFTEEDKLELMRQFQKIRYDYSVKLKKIYEKIKKKIPGDIPQERAAKLCGYLTSLTDVAQFYFTAEAFSGYYMMTSVNFTNESVSEMLAEVVDNGPKKYRNVVTEMAEMKNAAKKYENNFDVDTDYMENKLQTMIIDINKEGIANMH